MPSQGVERPKILSNNIEDMYVWEATQGVVSLFPSFFEGENLLGLGYAIDKVIKLYETYTLERLDKRHVSTYDIESLNYNELNNRMKQAGVPYTNVDNSIQKKIRLNQWWLNDVGGGTAKSIKGVLYDYIGSGVFIPYDGGNTISYDTDRILIANPSNGEQWGDSDIALYYIDWADYSASSGSGGTWGDITTVGLTDIDIQIKFGNFSDFVYWQRDTKRYNLYKIAEIVRPAGLIYTINNIYDGSLSDYILNYPLHKGGFETVNYYNVDNYGATKSSGVALGGYSITSGTYLSGVFNDTVILSGTDFSIGFAFKYLSDISTFDRILNINSSGTTLVRIHSESDFSQGLKGVIGDSTVGTFTSVDFTDGSWYYVLITADGGAGDIITYINNSGTTLASNFTNLSLYSGSAINIGKDTGDTNYGNFEIERIQMWDRILTIQERAELYSGIMQFVL